MTTPDMAVTVVEQSPDDAVVEWNLDRWPVDQYNRVIPTVTLGIANEFMRPIVQSVVLEIEADTYTSRDLKEGHRAPNARGLSKLADAAGVSFVDEERLDDGSDPTRAYVRIYAELVDPTGMRRRAPGSRDYRLDSQQMTDAQRQRAKGYVHENAATRAKHRALRALLSLPQSYPVADLRKPFAVVRYMPNMQHPEVRAAFKAAMAGSIAALYGPEPARQLSAGPSVQDVPEAPDDEAAAAAPVPQQLPGERLRAAGGRRVAPAPAPEAAQETEPDAEPDWMRDAPSVVETVAPQAAREPGLRDIVADRLRDEGQPKGPVNKAQQATLSRVFAGFGEERGTVFATGVRILFDTSARDLTCAQARAIGMAKDELGPEAFEAQWRELVA